VMDGIRVARKRVLRLMRENAALCSTRHRGLVRKDAVRFYHFGRRC
jgi:hypothetical protein